MHFIAESPLSLRRLMEENFEGFCHDSDIVIAFYATSCSVYKQIMRLWCSSRFDVTMLRQLIEYEMADAEFKSNWSDFSDGKCS
jgi:hypothetical protein